MATVTIDIPDDLKARCDDLLGSGTVTALLSRLLNEALEQETAQRRTQAVERSLSVYWHGAKQRRPPALMRLKRPEWLVGNESLRAGCQRDCQMAHSRKPDRAAR